MGRRLDWSRAGWENTYSVTIREEASPLYRQATQMLIDAERAAEEHRLAVQREKRRKIRLERIERKRQCRLRRQAKAALRATQDTTAP
jgi:KaiC/GvpD/RAD55 family RecA-like ATPase